MVAVCPLVVKCLARRGRSLIRVYSKDHETFWHATPDHVANASGDRYAGVPRVAP